MIPFRFSTICFHVVLLLAAVGMLSSCGRSESSRSLGEIESYMDSHSDSRLDDLLAIDSAALQSPGDRMLYEVLLTQALDKAHESIASRDSVMQVAADWFARRGDVRRAMLAHYFLGRSTFEKENYTECLVAMFKAHDLAKELDDKYWIGMSARGIADVYTATYNSADAVRYAEIELENLRLSGRQPYVNYAVLDLVNAYNNNRDTGEAMELSYQLLDSAKKYSDKLLYSEVQRSIAVILMTEMKFDKAISCFKMIMESGLATNKDSIFYGCALANIGRPDEAFELMSSLKLKNELDNWLKYEIYSNLEMRDSAFFNLEKEYHALNTKFRKRFNVSLLYSISNYYEILNRMNEERIESSKMLTWSLVVIVLLIISIGTIVSVRYYRASRERLGRNLMIAQNLRDILLIKTDECDMANKIIWDLIDNKVEMFDKLCRVIYENNDSLVAKKKISIAVNEFIEQFSINSEKFTELEELVNRSYDNIMLDLRHDLPNIKNADYALFLYTILGFSISTISIFLKEEKISAVYDRKRRLKDKIKKLDSPNREKYMDFLG